MKEKRIDYPPDFNDVKQTIKHKLTKEKSGDKVITADALAAMERAIARLKIAEKRKQRHRA